MKKYRLSGREKKFCIYFLGSGDPANAARRAGYLKNADEVGEELLCKEEIACELERLAGVRERALANTAAAGYKRLAFGNIADAVSLLYKENPTSAELGEMDLFSVSEIKRPRDGSMEIKFFDRLKALERLESYTPQENEAAGLFEAINKSARADGSDENGD